MSSFASQLSAGPSHGNGEDWEDWLRWDPAAEPTSPDDTTFHSGSSKNDSPLQDHALPVADLPYDKAFNEAFAPPVVVGEQHPAFDANSDLNYELLPFGLRQDVTSAFDFAQPLAIEQSHGHILNLDTNTTNWSIALETDAKSHLTPSALSAGFSQEPPSAMSTAGTASSFGNSPESSSHKRMSTSSISPDPPKKRGGRKRKADSQPDTSLEIMESGDVQDGDEPPVKKTSHNVIEKRYRNNLNDKIVELRNSVPSLRAMGRANGGKESEDLEGLTPAHKLNKATVMAKATEYIRHLEKRNQKMGDEMAALKSRLAAVEAALGRTSDRDGSHGGNQSSRTIQERKTSSASRSGASTFLNLPQEQSRYGQPVATQQYQSQHAQPTYARPPNPPVEAQNATRLANGRSGTLNKVMLGTMAGVIFMEGFSEQHQSGDGTSSLASIPTMLFKRASDNSLFFAPSSLLGQALMPLLRIFLVIGALFCLLAPLLSSPPRSKHHKTRSAVQLPQAPSLASPVEVRRKAWLTASQSVWVPKHFLLEVVAVCTKMIQLSVRRLIGSEAFTNVTGTSKEEEAARIKAWDIAIDAQLAGGDAAVSYYRLLLTLMESGTLPDSPTRLMQKAVHFRVFFWDVANVGYGNIFGFKRFTERVGKYYWDSARKIQKEIVQAKAEGRETSEDEIELLPDHLARLVELDCEEVLSDEMIQRAWNLAWNKPSAYCTNANAARDSVVEDHAIRSPLDAVAAWYTNATIDDTLADALGENASSFDTEYYIGLALSVAPPASVTHVRALAAKAILSSTNRDCNIIAALEALPVMSPTGGMNLVNHAPASPDVCTALSLAKLTSLLSPAASQMSRERAFRALETVHIAPMDFTLLTAVGSFRLLRLITPLRDLPCDTMNGVEDIAASLRVWVGTSAGKDAGLGREERGKIVTLCLNTAKHFGGWDEGDSGYGSASTESEATSVEQSPVPDKRQVVFT